MSMYTLAKELFSPTGIERVVRCNFVRPDILNVIVSKSTVLEIYNFTEPAQADQLPKLELVATHRLNGIITSMGVIRTSSSGQHGLDSILVSFKDAKMSLLEWSFSNHCLVTVSIHYYERDDYKQEFLNNSHPTEIRVDPSRRCAVLAFYGDRLAVLPFRQEETSIGEEDDASKKWPYLPSYVMTLSDIDIRIKNVIDMVFLYDFYEPTLAILFSPQQTWTGRLPVRKDTCSLVVVSLDITHKVYPIIYSIDQLPYDCTKVIAVPKPVGGLLVVSANALIHLDQGSTGMGVGVNGYAPMVTEFPLQNQHHFDIALEGSQHVFLAPDQILFTLRNGDMYVVGLQQEGRSLSGFKIEKAGTSMQTSCKCSLGSGYYFAGSRYADSMLIKYSTKDQVKKKKRIAAFPINSMDLEDELYGQDVETITDQPTDKSKDEIESAMDAGESKWQFEICDTLTNTGPILDLDIGQRASNESHSDFPPQHELVAATGSGQNGALVVFQRNIRPNVVRSTDALAGSNSLWTVYCRKEIIFEGVSQYESRKTGDGAEDSYDKLLIVSRETGTLVLATSGDDLRQLPNSQFYSEGPTVAIGSLLEETRIVQVYSGGVRLLNADCKIRQVIPIGEHLSIVAASIADPYILLQLHDGSALLLKGDMNTKDVTIVSQTSVLSSLPIKSCCVYADTLSTMLTVKEAPTMASLRSSVANTLSSSAAVGKKQKRAKKSKKEAAPIVDDVDLDLYGPAMDEEDEEESEEDDDVEMGAAPGTNGDVPMVDVDMENVQSTAKASMANPEGQSLQATHWCVIYRADGALEIYRLPDFKEVFFFPHFDLLPDVLPDAPAHQNTKPAGHAREITEMVMANMGAKEKRETYLVMRTYRGNIAVYKTYQHFPTVELDSAGKQIDFSDRLAIRFRKVPLDNVARETPEDEDPDERSNANVTEDDSRDAVEREIKRQERRRQRKARNLIPFTDVAGYEGVFVLGTSPLWIMSSGRGLPRVHPMICDGRIGCFTQFHNLNCKHGFITLNAEGNLRISQLPYEGVQYDMPWPIRKVPLKKAVRRIVYHPTSQTYVTVTAIPDPFVVKDENNVAVHDQATATAAGGIATPATPDTHAVLNGTADSNGHLKVKPTGPGFRPLSERQTLELVSPVTWETVDRFELNEYEIVTSIETVSLESSQDASGRKKFIAVGTSYIRGEDSAMRGTIYIFDIIDVVPEPDNPQTDHKLKLLHSEEVKGSVTAMAAICGYLLTCVGTKVLVRSFEDNETLTGIAFIDVQIFVTSVKVVKNTIMLADAYKSVWFIGFQDEPTKLVLLGKDYHPMESMNVSYLIENQTLNIVVADAEKNIRLLQYTPYNVQSFSGQKLICRGDYHVGSQIQTTIAVPKIVLSGSDEGISHLTLCGTLDGGLCMITPIPEKTSKRLALLSSQIVNGVQHHAGLNPRAFRLLQSKDRLNSNPAKGILDGDLLFEFVNLPANRQKEMTKQIGTGVDRVMDDLAAIAVAADHF
ncbi:CPSF A subunit region-domain-containing protein [Gamsiella multidivaricata]|uniref:CPSF A subunit region-domain-containing protein n=1 Tax=Gamsiella multidivaricata TaxID=101098 RepID=UPI002220F5A6|nr:CPSF A subunit region-domain-containing protein [Gamsiella multidivaricata]KAG0368622.1 Cleavage and polyadenylation specificity factor subunit 1 [Gamsiella multidivaricata]KAI7819896.1 CPSF A subunit region-domain-containing protein [Gamsiella multidivaricata]